jgi:hypothetical protein
MQLAPKVCILSGKVPVYAQEQFIQRIIDKTLEEDYNWLITVSTEKAARRLIEMRPNITPDYTIIRSDNLVFCQP